MGNSLSNGDGFAAWELMTEDTMLVILKHLTVYDYVQLSLACRRFLYFLLGPNNYFWAQLCNNLLSEEDQQPSTDDGHVMSQYYWNLPSPAELRYRPKNANDLLKYVQKGRKFIVDGRPVDLNRKINTIDKHFVSHFNFKEEIKTYFFDAILRVNLEMELRKLVQRSILQRITFPQPDLEAGL